MCRNAQAGFEVLERVAFFHVGRVGGVHSTRKLSSFDKTLPAWWRGEPARLHARRWIDDLGLTEDRIIETATETRRDHPNPPDGPKALDRFMERAAQRDAQAAADASGGKAKRQRKRDVGPPPSEDQLAAFYAAKVNSDEYLPANMISNAMCEAMLARGLVTRERLLLRKGR